MGCVPHLPAIRPALFLLMLLVLQHQLEPAEASDASITAPLPFGPINLAATEWYLKRGFDPADASGFDRNVDGVIRVEKFPIDPLSVFSVSPRSGLHHFTLMTSFELSKNTVPPLSVTVFRIGENWAFYLNGSLLRNEFHLGPDGGMLRRRSVFGPIVPIPNRFIRSGPNTLVLHLAGEARPTIVPLRHHMMLGASGFQITPTELAYRFTANDMLEAANIVYVFFALFYLVFYWWRPADPHPLYFGLFTLTFALYQLTSNPELGNWVMDTTWLHRVRWSSLSLIGIFAALFIQSFFFRTERLQLPFRLILYFGMAFCAWFLLAPFPWALAGVSAWQLHALFMIAILSGYCGLAWYRRIPYASTMAIGMILFGLMAVFDMVFINLYVHEFRISHLGALGLVTTMALLIAFRFVELHREADSIRRAVVEQRDAFARFVPRPFLDLLGRQSAAEIRLADNTLRPMSVLFSDIRGFTKLSESMTPQESFEFLNSYLNRVGPIIENDGGFVDKFLGDGLMALFAETEDRHKPVEARVTSADRAVAAAVKMQEEVQAYNRHRLTGGQPEIRIGIGVNSGDVILGTVGSHGRLDTTVVGDTVNVASRLEGLAAEFHVGILISDVTCRQLTHRDRHWLRKVGWIVLRGKAEAIAVYEVFDHHDDETRRRRVDTRTLLEAALEARRTGALEEASRLVRQAAQADPADPLLAKYAADWASSDKI